jgi:hypothetical protein
MIGYVNKNRSLCCQQKIVIYVYVIILRTCQHPYVLRYIIQSLMKTDYTISFFKPGSNRKQSKCTFKYSHDKTCKTYKKSYEIYNDDLSYKIELKKEQNCLKIWLLFSPESDRMIVV